MPKPIIYTISLPILGSSGDVTVNITSFKLGPDSGHILPSQIHIPAGEVGMTFGCNLGPDFESDTYQVRSDDPFGPFLFTAPLLKSIMDASAGSEQPTCSACASIRLDRLIASSRHRAVIAANRPELLLSASSCALCATFAKELDKFSDMDDMTEITVSVDYDSFFLHVGKQKYVCDLRLFTCAESKSPAAGEEDVSNKDAELPLLSEPGGPTQMRIIREWLNYCDTQHLCNGPCPFPFPSPSGGAEETELPTRVIDVGEDPSGKDGARVLVGGDGARGRYAALSHKWGTSQPFRALRSNIESLTQSIDETQLPQTFLDAVTVTRRLGIRYLWIDSLCIIQDDMDDWEREAKRMRSVYANAYLTIAATSAADSSAGFLAPRTGQEFFKFTWPQPDQDNDDNSDTPNPVVYYASQAATQAFDKDVEASALNQRAWVLQERALSSRILHFAPHQVYMECGYGIVSETLQHEFKPFRLIGGCNFPEPNAGYPRRTVQSAFEEVFAKFTRLAITRETDRPYAVAGLEERLASFYDTRSTFGVVHAFLARSLFWNRPPRTSLRRIAYPPDRADKVPSWSWMAYHGEIGYAHCQTKESPEWVGDLRLRGCEGGGAGESWTLSGEMVGLSSSSSSSCGGFSLRTREDGDCVLEDAATGRLVGWARFDDGEETHNIAGFRGVRLAGFSESLREVLSWKNSAGARNFEDELAPGGLEFLLLVGGSPLERAGICVVHVDAVDKLDLCEDLEVC